MRVALGVLVGFVLVAALGLVGIYVAQPTSFRIARTRTIAAPPERVMAHLSDLRAYEAWTPFPPSPGVHPTTTFSPSTSGVGAWVDRRDEVGGAHITITLVSSDRVELSNVTSGSFGEGASRQTFELRSTPTGTEVTWSLSSDLHGLARLLWPFVHLEARVGPEMEAALGRLDQASR